MKKHGLKYHFPFGTHPLKEAKQPWIKDFEVKINNTKS